MQLDHVIVRMLSGVGIAAVFAACSNSASSVAVTPSGGATGSQAPLAQTRPASGAVEFAYVTDHSDNRVLLYKIDPTTGALVWKQPYGASAGTRPEGVAIDPTGKFVYVTNYRSDNVSAYTIDPDNGDLTPIEGSPFKAGEGAQGIAVDPAGKFAYVTNRGSAGVSGDVSAYVIDPQSGALTPVAGSPFAAGEVPTGVAITPDGKFAYVTSKFSAHRHGLNGEVSAFAIDATSGALEAVPGSPFATGKFPTGVAITPNGEYAYVPAWQSHAVFAYTIDSGTGALEKVKGSPFAGGGGGDHSSCGIAIDPTGQYSYILHNNNFRLKNSAFGYRIDATSGSLTPVPGSPFAAGKDVRGIAVEPTGRFAYVTGEFEPLSSKDKNGNKVYGYSIDAHSGALKNVGSADSQSPFGIATCRVENGRCKPPPL